MRLLLSILLLFCATSTIQAFSLGELGDSLAGIAKSIGNFVVTIPDQYNEWKKETGEKNCPYYLEDLKYGVPVDGPIISPVFFYNFYKCDEILREAVGIRTFWGRLGALVRAMADLPFEGY